MVDLEAITDLVLAGRGNPVTARKEVLSELTAWTAHRARRVRTRTATKNQLLGQLDRSFPGLTLALPDVLGTKVGRLVAAEFADPVSIVRELESLSPSRRGSSCLKLACLGEQGRKLSSSLDSARQDLDPGVRLCASHATRILCSGPAVDGR